MSIQDNFHTQHDYIGYFQEFPGIRFTSISGGERTTEGTEVFSGGSPTPVNVNGPSKTGVLTLSKPAEDAVDAPLRAWCSLWSQGIHQKLTFVVMRVTPQGIPIPGAAQRTYLRCSHRSDTAPTLERGSAAVAVFALTVAPEQRTG